MTDYEYVKSKLDNKLFNTSEVSEQTGVSRTTLLNIKQNKQVRNYIVKLLADFFRKAGD